MSVQVPFSLLSLFTSILVIDNVLTAEDEELRFEPKLDAGAIVGLAIGFACVFAGFVGIVVAYYRDLPRRKHVVASPLGYSDASLRMLHNYQAPPDHLACKSPHKLEFSVKIEDFVRRPPNCSSYATTTVPTGAHVSWLQSVRFLMLGCKSDRRPIGAIVLEGPSSDTTTSSDEDA